MYWKVNLLNSVWFKKGEIIRVINDSAILPFTRECYFLVATICPGISTSAKSAANRNSQQPAFFRIKKIFNFFRVVSMAIKNR
jgi:hypothetical protein